ncbi:MAG: LUD domain-containing protein [Opitutaceae bacterium]
MSEQRERVLGRVRDALAPLPERAAYPDYDPAMTLTYPQDGPSPWERFKSMFTAVHGRTFESVSDLGAWLVESQYLKGCCDPDLFDLLRIGLPEKLVIETAFDRHRIDEFTFGISRARGAIAESGSLVLDDATTWSRLAALAPWVHVAVLRRADLWRDIPTAITHFGNDPNIIWVTGPSKTADVEGILIEGVHGPGEQVCLLID